MKKLLSLLIVLLLITPAAAGAETVMTSFYPIWLLALNLTEGLENVQVVNLAGSSTGCLHDYALQNSDMAALSQADLLLVNGAGMESFLPVISGAYPDLPVIEAAEGLPFLSESGIVEIGETEEGETVNSHLWLDPQRASGMAANLAEGLISLLPDQETKIRENLDLFRNRMLALDETLREASEGLDRKVVIFHEAFPYFAEACGLSVAAVVNKEPEDDLSSAQLARILDLIRREDTLPLIVKSSETDRSVEVLVHEAGVPVCELDPLTSGPDDPPPDYYETVMIQNLKKLLEAVN